jgi:hypothetical protein
MKIVCCLNSPTAINVSVAVEVYKIETEPLLQK